MGGYLGTSCRSGGGSITDFRGLQEAIDSEMDAGCHVDTLGDELRVDMVVGKEISEAVVGRQGTAVLVDLMDYRGSFQVSAW